MDVFLFTELVKVFDVFTKKCIVFQQVVQSFGLTSDVLKTTASRQQAAIAAGLGEKDPAALISFAYREG